MEKIIISKIFANDRELYASPTKLLNLFEREQNEKETKRGTEIWGLAQYRIDMLPVKHQLSRAHVIITTGVILLLIKDSRTPSWFTDPKVLVLNIHSYLSLSMASLSVPLYHWKFSSNISPLLLIVATLVLAARPPWASHLLLIKKTRC